jgi:hypothetical protein
MREHLREHGRAVTLGALALGAGLAAAAATVSIATGHTARSTPVFARSTRLVASRSTERPSRSCVPARGAHSERSETETR